MKKMHGKQLKQNLFFAFLCPVLYCVILWNTVPFVYGVIDDLVFRQLVSGEYLGYPDAHTVFIGYWYSLFIAKLYKWIPNIDWCGFCYIVLMCICMSLMVYRLLLKKFCYLEKIIICVSVVFVYFCLGIRFFTRITFTTTAALLGVTVIFWYMTAENSMKGTDYVVLFFLCFLTAEIRFSILVMIIPVGGILWLFRFKENPRSHFGVPLIVLSAILFCFSGWLIGYRGQEWRIYNQFNNARSQIYDYSKYRFPEYSEEKDFYAQIGIVSENQVKNLKNANYAADEKIGADFFVSYYETRHEIMKEKVGNEKDIKNIVESMVLYIKAVLLRNYGFDHFLALFGYGGLLLCCIHSREWKESVKICMICGIQIIVWIYMVYKGRMPERVLISMNLLLVVPLLLLWKDKISRWGIWEKIGHKTYLFLFITLSIITFYNIIVIRKQNIDGIEADCKEEILNDYCAEYPENFYFVDAHSLPRDFYEINLWEEEPRTMNYMTLGGWIAYSPMWKEKLEQNGFISVKEALFEHENVYLVCKKVERLDCLCSLYDNVSYTKEGEIMDCIVYKLHIL